MSLTDYQTLTMALTRDDAGKLTSADRDAAIAAAVRRYSEDRPRPWVEDVTATAANLAPLPASWEADFSAIRSIESPVDNVPPTYLESDAWWLYQDTSQVERIQLRDAVNVGDELRVTFTVRHTVSSSTDTIRQNDREAVCCWAAALLCDQLAAQYANSGDSTLQADSVDHTSRAREYGSRAGKLRQRYFDGVGVDPKRNGAGGTTVNWQTGLQGGGDRLTHPRRFR